MSVKVKGYELERAAYNGKTDEILRLWHENGDALDVENDGGGGVAPLHYAARDGYVEACRALVSTCRANVDSRDSDGWTPLMYAACSNKLQCVEVLLELGADITLQNDDKRTALWWARKGCHAEVAAFLEAAGRIPEIKSAHKV
jgi:ankyrin repeat protein